MRQLARERLPLPTNRVLPGTGSSAIAIIPAAWPSFCGVRQMHLDALAAYIDPGSGSLIIQAVIATIVAIPFFFRQQIGRVVRTLRRDGTAEETVTPVPPTTPDPR